MLILFFAIPAAIFVMLLLYLLYHIDHDRKARKRIKIESIANRLDRRCWKGGVRYRMGLVKTMEEYYEIEKNIKFP